MAIYTPQAQRRRQLVILTVVAFLLGDGGRAFTGVPVTMDLGWTAR